MTYTLRVLGCDGFRAVATLKDKEALKLLLWFYKSNGWSSEVRFITSFSVKLRWF